MPWDIAGTNNKSSRAPRRLMARFDGSAIEFVLLLVQVVRVVAVASAWSGVVRPVAIR